MSEAEIKSYYKRCEKLLDGYSPATYGFSPGEIKNILNAYKRLQKENKQLKNNWNKLENWLKQESMKTMIDIVHLSVYDKVLDKIKEIKGKLNDKQ